MKTAKPAPFSTAAGAVAYALAVTFRSHLTPDLLAALPALVVAVGTAFERAASVVQVVAKDVATDATKVAEVATQTAVVAGRVAQAASAPSLETR